MIARVTKALQKKESGFTLIELLVVVLIIGVLAAIAIPVYLGVQQTARDNAVKGHIKNTATAVQAHVTMGGELTPTTQLAAIQGYTESEDITTQLVVASASAWCVEGYYGDETGNTFAQDTGGTVVSGECAADGTVDGTPVDNDDDDEDE